MQANYPQGGQGFNGNSCAYNHDGSIIVEANEKEQVVMAKFNINDIRKARMENMKRIKSHQILRNM